MCMVKCEYLKVCIMVACLSLFTTYGSKRGPKNQNTLTQRDYLRAFDIMSLLCCVWLKESCAPAVKGQRSGSSCGPRVLGRTR